MLKEKISSLGEVHILLTDKDGNVKVDRVEKNMVVNGGLEFITSRLLNGTSPIVSHMGVGTNNTATTGATNALAAEVARANISSAGQVTTTVTNDSVQYVATFIAGQGTGALVEAGLFNAGLAGTMVARLLFGVVTKGADDALTLTWKIKFANAA